MRLTLAELKTAVATYVDSSKISVASFSATYNNAVGLLDTIAKIYTIPSNYVDKLEFLDGEDFSYGKTVEEWKSDLKLMEDYVSSGSGALDKFPVTYRPVAFSFTLGRKYVPVSIENNDIERAVHNEGQFAEIIADKYKVMTDSEKVYRYAMKRQALAVLIARCVYAMNPANATLFATTGTYAVNALLKDSSNNVYVCFRAYTNGDASSLADAIAKGFLVQLHLTTEIAKPVDTTTAEAFIEELKKDVEVGSDNSQGFSLNGNCLGAEALKLIMLQGILPTLEVKAQAGAFQGEKVALPAESVSIPDFGNDSNDAFALLIDPRGVKVHNTYRAVRENVKGQGDWLTMFFHVEYTIHISRNTFVKVYIAQ